jgi:hypothetical protein
MHKFSLNDITACVRACVQPATRSVRVHAAPRSVRACMRACTQLQVTHAERLHALSHAWRASVGSMSSLMRACCEPLCVRACVLALSSLTSESMRACVPRVRACPECVCTEVLDICVRACILARSSLLDLCVCAELPASSCLQRCQPASVCAGLCSKSICLWASHDAWCVQLTCSIDRSGECYLR